MSKVKYDTVDTVIGGIRETEVERGMPTTEERRPGVPQHREQLEGTSLGRVQGNYRCGTHEGPKDHSKLEHLRMEGLPLGKVKLRMTAVLPGTLGSECPVGQAEPISKGDSQTETSCRSVMRDKKTYHPREEKSWSPVCFRKSARGKRCVCKCWSCRHCSLLFWEHGQHVEG